MIGVVIDMRRINKILLHQYVLFGVFGTLLLRTILVSGLYLGLGLLWWLLGGIFGFLFVFVDSFVFGLLTHPNEVWSDRLKAFFDKRVLRQNIEALLEEKQDQKMQIMRSILFLLVWVVLGFLTMTSVANDFSRGFVLGIGTHLVFDFVYDYFYDPKRFEKWFWQIKRELSHEEKRNVLIGVCFVYFVLAMRF